MATDVSALAMGATCFIAQVCRDLGIAQTINRIVSWDKEQCNISPGSRIVALIVNILVQRRPLYLVNEFYEQLDLPLRLMNPSQPRG